MFCKTGLPLLLAFVGLTTTAVAPTLTKLDKYALPDYIIPGFWDLLNSQSSHQEAETSNYFAVLNDYLDYSLFPNLKEYARKNELDTIALPGFDTQFNLAGVDIRIKLANGSLAGLSNVKRTGDVVLTYNHPNLSIKLPLGVDKLHCNYDYAFGIMDVGANGRVDAGSDSIAITTELNIDLSTTRVSLTAFKVDTLGSFKVEFSGNEVDKLINELLKLIIPQNIAFLESVVQDIVEEILEVAIDLLNSITCNYLQNC